MPMATVLSQLQGLGIDSSTHVSKPLDYTAVQHRSSSPSGSLASGSSISRVSGHSELGGFPGISSISALQSSLHSRLSDTLVGHGGGATRNSTAVSSSVPFGVLPPEAHASIPGSFHGSISNSGTVSPQRFVGSLGTASEPPTLPPAGESAFASFSGGPSSGPPQRFDNQVNSTAQRFGVHSLSNRSSGSGSSALAGYGALASGLPQQRTPQWPVPLHQHLQHSGQQNNPFPQYNMQQPSAAFYASSHGDLKVPSSLPSPMRSSSSGSASPAWPPPEPTLNLNKAITKRLTSATHFQQLLDIIAESSMYFDEVIGLLLCHKAARDFA